MGKLRVNKNFLMLFVSLALGGLGVYLSQDYIQDKVSYYKSQLEKTGDMVRVVVPKRAMRRGEHVTASDLAVREIPAEIAHAGAINESNVGGAVGRKLAADILEGRPLLWVHLEGASQTFSKTLPEGVRALTIPVDEINSISGFLQPTDNVDLFLSRQVGKERAVIPIMQNLHVLATGTKTEVDEYGQPTGRVYSTITVKVTPEDAKRIVLAQDLGKITATLRNPEDSKPISKKIYTASQLLGKKKIRKVRKTAKKRGIEYIVGG